MANVQGLVKVVKKNDAGFYSVKMGDDWFGAGKYAPKFNEGDEVSFDYTENGKYKNMTFGTVKVLETAPPAGMTSAANTSSGGTDWDAKDKRITFLACRKDAIEIAKLAVQNEMITLPAKKADRLDTVVGLIDGLTGQLYEGVYDEPFLVNYHVSHIKVGE